MTSKLPTGFVAAAERMPNGDLDIQPFVRQLAELLVPQLPRLVDELVERIFERDPFYRQVRASVEDEVHDAVEAHLGQVVRGMAGLEELDFELTRELARSRGVEGIPISALLNAYRLAAEVIWEHLVHAGRELAGREFTPEEVLAGALRVWTLTNRFSSVISEAYDETVAERIRRVERDRTALLDALFDGRMTGDIGPGDVGHRLGLPDRATFVAVVAEDAAADPVDALEEELQSAGVRSVWRTGPDRVTGIVVLRDERTRPERIRPAALDPCLAGHLRGRIGVSPPFLDLADVPNHVALADVARRCTRADEPRVVHHEHEPIATLAVHMPGAARRSARVVLAPILDLPGDERVTVLATLQAWMDSGGSTPGVAERLYCHRNTARNRVARVEALIGRPLSDPRVAAEIVLAMTAWRLDPDGLR